MKINASNSMYDFLNALVRYILPAVSTLYFTLSEIWGFPYAEEVVGTIAAVALFAGIIIGLARQGWKTQEVDTDGDLLVDAQEEGSNALTVALNRHPDELRDKDDIRLKVISSSQK